MHRLSSIFSRSLSALPSILIAILCVALADSAVLAQGGTMPMPPGAGADTPPSLKNNQANQGSSTRGQVTGGGQLPRSAGQEHRVYDLRPYTGYLTKHDHPEQAIVDWVLRETGTDVWFTAPFLSLIHI